MLNQGLRNLTRNSGIRDVPSALGIRHYRVTRRHAHAGGRKRVHRVSRAVAERQFVSLS
jgi:hypothetical protein